MCSATERTTGLATPPPSCQTAATVLAEELDALFPDGLSGFIFDCDGVLVDSRDANIGYYNMLLAELGRPPVAEEQIAYVHMATAQQALEYLFSSEDLKLLPDIAQKRPYKDVALPLLQLEPGLNEMLFWLRQKGIQLGVHTNRGQGMWDLLERFQLENVFQPVMTADNVKPKPHPEGVQKTLAAWKLSPRQVVFVGDSATDASAAGGAGVPLFAYRNPVLPAALHIDSFVVLHEALKMVVADSSSCSA